MAVPFRALSQWWLASVYGLKWFMQFAQIYGVPLRWGVYPTGDIDSKVELSDALEQMGASSWAAVPDGNSIEIKEASKGAGELPQSELVQLADKACDVMILGATLTSDNSNTGSRALGGVHQDTEIDAVESVADFVEETLNEQMIPAIMRHAFGEDDKEIPWIEAKLTRPKDELSMAMRDKTLIMEGGMKVSEDWIYDRYGIPVPGKGEKVFKPAQQDKFNPNDVKEKRKADVPPGDKPADPQDSDNPDSPQAQRAAAKAREQVVDEELEKLSGGVAAKYIGGVREEYDKLLAMAISGRLSDEEVIMGTRRFMARLPELFGDLETDVLRESLEDAAGRAMMEGALDAL